jgi:hypothetical protein
MTHLVRIYIDTRLEEQVNIRKILVSVYEEVYTVIDLFAHLVRW